MPDGPREETAIPDCGCGMGDDCQSDGEIPATPCLTCMGAGHLGPATNSHQRDYGRECPSCSGS